MQKDLFSLRCCFYLRQQSSNLFLANICKETSIIIHINLMKPDKECGENPKKQFPNKSTLPMRKKNKIYIPYNGE